MVDRPKPDIAETRPASPGGGGPVPASDHRDGWIAAAIAGLVLVTVLIGTLAPAPSAHRTAAPSQDSACAEWTDGCQVCQRVADGIACSLPGIACVPAAPRCERRIAD